MTSLVKPSRRKFITGLGAIFAAPAIVKYSSLMPIKPIHNWINVYASYSCGILYEAAIWDRLLTIDEIEALSKGRHELNTKLFRKNDLVTVTYGGILDERQIR